MTLRLPGSVLILDDNIGEIQQLQRSFGLSGHGVIYINTLDIPENFTPKSVRLAIFDLRMSEHEEMTENDKETICQVLRAISSRSNFFLYVIWSDLIGEDPDPWYQEQLAEHYREKYNGEQIPGVLIDSLGKNYTDHVQLIDKIESFLANQPIFSIIFEWERLLDEARDNATNFLNSKTQLGLEVLIHSLLKELEEEFSVTKELVSILNGILLDCVQRILPEYSSSSDILIRQISDNHNPRIYIGDLMESLFIQFGELYSRYSYSYCENLILWTGDIFHFPENTPSHEFALVVTPMCDMSEGAPNRVDLIYGARLKSTKNEIEELISEMNTSFPRGNDTTVVQAIKFFTGESRDDKLQSFPYIQVGSNFQFCLFDYTSKEEVDTSSLDLRKRIWRINRPLIDGLIARIIDPSTRIGTLILPDLIRKYLREKTKAACGIN